jgi:hypothetical protein
MKPSITAFFTIGMLLATGAEAQTTTTATVSYVLGLGPNMTCTTVTSHGHTTTTKTEKDGFDYLEYTSGNNTLIQPPSVSYEPCYPSFPAYAQTGVTTGPDQVYNSSLDYNPADQKLYYFSYVDTTIGGVSTWNTYMFSWNVGTCPTSAVPVAEFKNTFLYATHDPNGTLWAVNFVSNGSGGYNLFLQQITVVGSTVTLGPDDPIVLSAGTPNITTTNGDIIFTPQGQMFVVVNNEEIAIATSSYSTSSTLNIAGTYVSTIAEPAGTYVVGLAFAEGTMIGALGNGTAQCTGSYVDINMVNGSTTPATYTGGFNSNDNTSVTSGVGAAKSLVSVTSTGNPNEVNVVYDVTVKIYGNYPAAYVQATDNLGSINGPGNVKSVSLSWVTAPPAADGINLNPSFNGTTNDSLLVAGGTLYNFPVATDYFIIQVSATLEGINLGTIYYNTAVAYGVGFNGDRLTDTSTNGNNPNPNNDGKPDDPGEDIPTPFLLQITPSSAPCTTLPTLIFQETFGAGSSSLTTALPAGGTTQYTGVTAAPIGVNDYTVTNNANHGNTSNFVSLTDHTTGTGDMMLVSANAIQNLVYQATVSNLCSGIKYSLNAYVANIDDTAHVAFCNAVGGYSPPNLTFQIYDPSDMVTVANLTTGPIWNHTWASFGMRVPLPTQVTSGSVEIQIFNNGGGGCGNDFAIDDISFGRCDPQPQVSVNQPSAGCLGSTTTLIATLTDTTVFSGDTVVYVWQDSIPGSGVWSSTLPPNVTQNTSAGTMTISPVNTGNSNIYYRVNVANSGNNFKSCSYYSPGYLIATKAPSTAPVSVSASPGTSETCSLVPITLTEVGGVLGDGAVYQWYTNGCGTGTSIGAGTSIVVEPSVTTAYFVQAVGACNTTTCAGVTINNICVLPTNLLYFQGSLSSSNDLVTLSWAVTDNSNLTQFYVERSLDGVTFTRIDSVQTVNEDGNATYAWNDNVASLHTETITYRIILVFKSGDTQPSNVVAINKPITFSGDLIVYPNPANTQLTIGVNSNIQQTLTYTMYNMLGQLLVTGSQVLSRGVNSVNVNGLSNVPSGAYILKIQMQDGVVQKKIIIQK